MIVKLMYARRAWKVSLIGSKGSGKSSLISKMVYGSDAYESDPKSLKKKSLTVEKDGNRMGVDLFFLELDETGNSDKLLSGSNAIIVLLDVTNPGSIEEAEYILKFILSYGEKALIMIAATKQDLRYEAAFWDEDVRKLASKYGVKYFMTSAKNSQDSNRFLDGLVSSLLDKFSKSAKA